MQAITVLSFFKNHIENRVDEFSSFNVMPLGPIVSSSRLAENEVVGPEDLAISTRSDVVHGTRFQIHENSTRNIATVACFIVVNVDSLEL